MPIEQDRVIPLSDWLLSGFTDWLILIGCLAAAMVVISWLIVALQSGFGKAFQSLAKTLRAGVQDLVFISPRRVAAMTWLAVKESIRRKVVVVFAIFILILLFGGWFLLSSSPNPGRLYLTIVLTTTSYLVLLMVLFLSTLSLPTDIKNKTIYTVVTKPVRPSEILLGRIFGFTIVGTVLLVVMGGISYGFVVRGLRHTHEIDQEELQHAATMLRQRLRDGQSGPPIDLQTASNRQADEAERRLGHVHRFRLGGVIRPGEGMSADGQQSLELRREGRVRSDERNGHWHELSYKISGDTTGTSGEPKITATVGPPQGALVSRVPIYGSIRFKDRDGNDAAKGINVGDEWNYREFVAGGTAAAAIWTFEGITEDRFPEEEFPRGIPLELTIEVFRTYKGDTTDETNIPGILGTLAIRNPDTGLMVLARMFTAKEFTIDTQYLPRTIQAPDGRTIDLFKDLVSDGKLEVWLKCVPPAQYFGAARADMYIRAGYSWFPLNFAKGYVGIWLQMVLVICIGVMFSTFLSAPIAIVATAGAVLGGFFVDFMATLAAGENLGGGPVESLARLVTQDNVISELDDTVGNTTIQMTDKVLANFLGVGAKVLPPLNRFSFADFVAYGFNIPGDAILESAFRAAAFLIPVFVAGYFFLKTREVAR